MKKTPSLSSTLLPDHILRCMSREDRRALGKAGLTTAEAIAGAEVKSELALQDDIAAYLQLREIPYILPNGRKKSPLPVGWPDFTFAYRGVPIGMEVKTPIGRLSAEQEALHPRLAGHGWRVVIVRSLPEVRTLLRTLDAVASAVDAALSRPGAVTPPLPPTPSTPPSQPDSL